MESINSWPKAWQKLVENSKLKKNEPSLYGLYWSLLYISAKQHEQFLAWVNKVLNGSNSFLYGGTTNSGVVAHYLAMANLKIGSLFFAMKNAAPQTLALCITLSHKQYKENDIILSSLEDILKITDPSTPK